MHRNQEVTSRKIFVLTLSLLSVLNLFTFSAPTSYAAEIRVGCEVEACKGLFEVVQSQIQDETGIMISVKHSSSEQALLDLERSEVDIVATDIPLESLINDLVKKGYLILQESFHSQGIGTNTVLVYLNKDNKVQTLTQSQLRDIFSGRITNWKQVGGDNQKIAVVWSEQTAELNRLFSKYVIGNKVVVKSSAKASSQRDIVDAIAKNPGAIGIASHVYKSGRTRNPVTPYVSAKIVAITKGAPDDNEQKLLELVKSYDY